MQIRTVKNHNSAAQKMIFQGFGQLACIHDSYYDLRPNMRAQKKTGSFTKLTYAVSNTKTMLNVVKIPFSL